MGPPAGHHWCVRACVLRVVGVWACARRQLLSRARPTRPPALPSSPPHTLIAPCSTPHTHPCATAGPHSHAPGRLLELATQSPPTPTTTSIPPASPPPSTHPPPSKKARLSLREGGGWRVVVMREGCWWLWGLAGGNGGRGRVGMRREGGALIRELLLCTLLPNKGVAIVCGCSRAVIPFLFAGPGAGVPACEGWVTGFGLRPIPGRRGSFGPRCVDYGLGEPTHWRCGQTLDSTALGGALPSATLLPPRTPAHSPTTATEGRSTGQRRAG